MVTNKGPDEQIADLKKQIDILQQQLALVNAQYALDSAKQTQEAQRAKAVAEALKNQVTAQFNLESEQAKLPLAELAGVKAALGGMQLPTGKSGTVQIAAGPSGTELLRSKGPMLKLLDTFAQELHQQLPNGAVIVNEAQLDQAYQADFTQSLIADQTNKLKGAIERASPIPTGAKSIGLPQFAAAAFSLGFVLDTVNSLAKLFRTDRKIDVFAADAEALQMLGYMLESKSLNFLSNPAMVRKEVLTEAKELLKSLNDLFKAIHEGNDLLAQPTLPSAEIVTELKMQIEAANSLLDGIHPGKKPDAFWAQVKGQLIRTTLKGRKRILLEAKALALQITESKWWKSDRIGISGEVQIAYRLLDEDGKIMKSEVILRASKAEATSFHEMLEFPFTSRT